MRIEQRLYFKNRFPLTVDYVKRMDGEFEPPKIKHSMIVNDIEGSQNLIEQIEKVLKF